MSALGKCKECNLDAIGELCSFCSGARKRPEFRVMTDRELKEAIVGALGVCQKLIEPVREMTKGPGEAVLACLMMAQGLVETCPDLPPLEWYLARVLELPMPGKPGMQ